MQTVDIHAKDIEVTVGAIANDVTDVKSTLISMNSPRLNHVASVEIVNKSHFIVPNRRVNGFIGREDILDKIEKGLSSESQSHVVVLRGLGGQGKTQIALEYYHRARKNNIRNIFWSMQRPRTQSRKTLTQFGNTLKSRQTRHKIIKKLSWC